MPKGPNGEKRPADSVGLAVLIGRIATGEVEDAEQKKDRIKKVGPASKTTLLQRRRRQKPS